MEVFYSSWCPTDKIWTAKIPRSGCRLVAHQFFTYIFLCRRYTTTCHTGAKLETLYNRKATNGMQPSRKTKTSLRKHRGIATPSPSWVLFEADGATTTFRKAPSPKARANLYRKRTSHAEVCKLSHDRLFFVSLILATKEMKRNITHPYTPP